MGMYIHIPFCVKKCNYCDFLSGPSTDAVREKYVESLCRELEKSAEGLSAKEVVTIFFGGGTPSVLTPLQTEKIFETIRRNYQIASLAEITTEANPGTLDEERLKAYKEIGFNRLSMGLQSAKNEELKVLGRIHTYEEFRKEYEAARKAGFSNINVDLMSSVPDQTPDSWYETLHCVAGMKPEHISAYSLILEEGTVLHEWYEAGKLKGRLVDEETDRIMYHETKRILEGYGYERYEISNYAREGYICRHNLAYWERGNYAGFGIGAASLIDNVRYHNTNDLQRYLDKPEDMEKIREDIEKLSKKDCMEEFMFLGLRKTAGVRRSEFYRNFQEDIQQVYGGVLKEMQQEKLLVCEEDRIYLTELGNDVSNVVMAKFLL